MRRHEICGFEHLHRHSDFSLLDGFATVEEYAKRSSLVNQKYLCISDHGAMGAIPRQIKACDDHELEPIFACLFRGQTILTREGVKSVENVVEGDYVLTHRGRYRRVIRTMKKQHDGPVYEIRQTKSGRKIANSGLFLTGDHPVLIRNHDGSRDWVEAKDILGGRRNTKLGLREYNSYVCFPRSTQESEFPVIRVEDYLPDFLRCNDNGFVAKIIKSNKYDYLKVWNISQFINVDDELAYFLGLFVAEGSYSVKHGKLTGGFRISLHQDEIHLAKRVSDFLWARFSIKTTNRPKKTGLGMDVTCACLPLAHILYGLCKTGAKHKKIPNEILEGEFSVKASFVQGLLDGDGKNHLRESNPSKQRTLRVASRTLAWQFKKILADLGTWANVRRREEKGKVCYNVPYSPFAARPWYFSDKDYVYKPIGSVIRHENMQTEVYNFEVEEDNSYVSDFVVHNCELFLNPWQEALPTEEERKVYMDGLNEEEKFRLRKNYHLLAVAYNETGYSNLVRLSSWGYINGWGGRPTRPRVNYDQLMKHKEGIIFTSCCYASEIGYTFDTLGEDAAMDMVAKYIAMFGSNFRLEIMLLDFHKQKPYDRFILKAHAKFGVPVIVTQDCHYCNPEDSKYQRYMLMVQTGRSIAEIERLQAEGADLFELQDQQLWMKSEDELNTFYDSNYSDVIDYDLFKQAKRETVKLCEKARGVKLDRTNKLPIIENDKQKLAEAVFMGFNQRKLPKTAEYQSRIIEEIELIGRKGFASYFLIQKMMTDEARRICPSILGWGDGTEAVGPGRGSAVGSLSCYCLGITDVDPIKHDLLFSRFLSEARGGKSMKLKFTNIDPVPIEEVDLD
jgi:DNA polymerase-3 subunit alpha